MCVFVYNGYGLWLMVYNFMTWSENEPGFRVRTVGYFVLGGVGMMPDDDEIRT